MVISPYRAVTGYLLRRGTVDVRFQGDRLFCLRNRASIQGAIEPVFKEPSGLEGGFAASGCREQEGHMRHTGQKGRAMRVSYAINATDERPTAGVHASSRRRIGAHVKRAAKAARPFIACVTRVALTGKSTLSHLTLNRASPPRATL